MRINRMSHAQKLILIERLAVAFDALWSLFPSNGTSYRRTESHTQ